MRWQRSSQADPRVDRPSSRIALIRTLGGNTMLKVFSFGGGVQSTAALVLAAQGQLDYRVFLFCNVGADSENPDTLSYVSRYALPYAEEHALTLIELHYTRRDGSQETLFQRLTRPDSRSIGIPVRMSNGAPGRRACTVDFKIKQVDRWLRAHGAVASGAFVGLGISLDELTRMRTNTDPDTLAWKTLDYPLIDLRLDRAQCVKIIRRAGLPVPPKSSCWFCPYHSQRTWQEMRQSHPALFQRAVELEALLNERRALLGRDRVFFSSKLKPLDQATSEYDQLTFLEEDLPCESGYCFI